MENTNKKIIWSRKQGYQINSKTDKRFSPFYTILSTGKSIEEAYQTDIKGYASIAEGKGKPPLDLSKCPFTEYLHLWRKWAIGKDDLLLDLFNKVVQNDYIIGDFFASTSTNQAHALSIILNEKYLGYKRVIVAGSRSITDYLFVKEVLDNCGINISTIISGTAMGVDTLGERFARENNISIERFAAQWDIYGNSAGYVRNTLMANNADWLICVWDGKSKGSKHMLDIARNKKLNILSVLKTVN